MQNVVCYQYNNMVCDVMVGVLYAKNIFDVKGESILIDLMHCHGVQFEG